MSNADANKGESKDKDSAAAAALVPVGGKSKLGVVGLVMGFSMWVFLA